MRSSRRNLGIQPEVIPSSDSESEENAEDNEKSINNQDGDGTDKQQEPNETSSDSNDVDLTEDAKEQSNHSHSLENSESDDEVIMEKENSKY